MTSADFSASFLYFKEGSRQINESKAPEWMEVKVKTKEVDISNDDWLKMARLGDYWDDEQTTEIINLLKEF